MIVPAASIVLVVDDVLVTPSVEVVVVVLDCCAKAVVSAIALTAATANTLIELFVFMFVLSFPMVRRSHSAISSLGFGKLLVVRFCTLFVSAIPSGRLT